MVSTQLGRDLCEKCVSSVASWSKNVLLCPFGGESNSQKPTSKIFTFRERHQETASSLLSISAPKVVKECNFSVKIFKGPSLRKSCLRSRYAQLDHNTFSIAVLILLLSVVCVHGWVGEELHRRGASDTTALAARTPSCSTTVCADDRRCVVRGGEERCVCSPKCYLKNKSHVCGSDDRTYRSECHLLKRACRKKRRLLVKHYGSCQTCSGVKCRPGKSCVLGEDLVPRCRRCPPHCVPRSPRRPVCAADGNTYLSSCHLKTASCETGRVIVRAYRGPCQVNATCSTVRCWRGQRCLTHHATGLPQCYACNSRADCRSTTALRQVCGADGRKYSSMCAVMHESCRTGRALAAAPRSFCNDKVHRARKSCGDWQRWAALRRQARLALHALRLRTVHPLQHTAMSRYGLLYAQNEVDSADTPHGLALSNNVSESQFRNFGSSSSAEWGTKPTGNRSDSQARAEGTSGRSLENLQKKLQSDIIRKRAMSKNCRRRRRQQKNIKKTHKQDSLQQSGNSTTRL